MDMFSTHYTFHEKKYIALYVYSDIEPGSQMARAPTRRAEAVGAPKCSIPLKIWLEVNSFKGTLSWLSKVYARIPLAYRTF